MANKIMSNQNKYIKHVRSLKIKKYRDISGQYLIEGIKLMQEAIINNVNLSILLFSSNKYENKDIKDIIDIYREKNIPIYDIDERVFKEIAGTESSQGIIGVAQKPIYDIDDVLSKHRLNIIILNEIQDPGNLGTIIRTADACGFDCVILSKGCVDVYNDKTVRATMGSLFRIPIITNMDIIKLMDMIDKTGVFTIGADPYGNVASFDLNYKDKNAIIVGNESSGLPRIVKDRVACKVNIPMLGRAESLNAAVAASILMYEVMRNELKR